MVGFVNFFFSAAGIFTAKIFPRRFLLINGHLIMGLSNVGVGICALYEMGNGVLVFMLIHVVFIRVSSSCVSWPYCTEVTVDAALGSVGLSSYMVSFILLFST